MANSKESKILIDLKEKAVKGFISELSFLVNAVYAKNTNDQDFIFLKDAFTVAKNENPEVVTISSGPYIWKYREQIEKGNVDFIINNDYSSEIEAIKTEIDNSYDQVTKLLSKIKSSWSSFSSVEQGLIVTKVKNLVVHYATYLGAVKKLKQ
jgi:hypothetical protein